MTKASSVIDVVLGEAAHGTREERYRDMLGIASVISNRATLSGKPMRDIVAHRGEFNAYGKALPSGVNSYRAMAEQALNDVLTNGPVHNATYYATPKASKNLPAGLQPVDQTKGHVYYVDPEFRSFRTATGWARPDPARMQTAIENPPVPTPRPDIPAPQQVAMEPLSYAPEPSRARSALGLAALAPNGLVSFDKAWQDNLHPATQDALTGAAAELERDLSVTSGYRPSGYNARVGGAPNSFHTKGMAADIDMSGMTTKERQDLVQELTQRGVGGFITYSKSPDMMHVDMRPREPTTSPHFMHDRTSQKMKDAPGWFQEMAEAGGIKNPDVAPTPSLAPRDEPAVAATARAAEDASMAALAAEDPAMVAAAAPPATEPTGLSLGLVSPAAAAPAPSLPDPNAALMANVQEMPATAPVPTARPAPMGLPQLPATPPAPPLPEPRVIKTPQIASVPAPPAAPSPSVAAPEPSVPSGMHAISSVFGAPEGAMAVSRSIPGISFSSLGNGLVEKTNQFGHTSIMSPDDYSHPSVPGPATQHAMRDPNEALTGSLTTGGLSSKGKKEDGDFPGFREIAGAVAGAAIGNALLGPMGGLVGARLGASVGQRGIGGTIQGVHSNLINSPLGRLFGGGFPEAPAAPAQAGGGGRSHAEMSGISPGAAGAISRGAGGLF